MYLDHDACALVVRHGAWQSMYSPVTSIPSLSDLVAGRFSSVCHQADVYGQIWRSSPCSCAQSGSSVPGCIHAAHLLHLLPDLLQVNSSPSFLPFCAILLLCLCRTMRSLVCIALLLLLAGEGLPGNTSDVWPLVWCCWWLAVAAGSDAIATACFRPVESVISVYVI